MNKELPSADQHTYMFMLSFLTVANACMLYLFGMRSAFSYVFYLIYFILSTAAVYYFLFALKKRKSYWWILLFCNIYLTLHPALLCLIIGLQRTAYYGRFLY